MYARKNAVNSGQADFALDIAKKSLDYFENVYFGISEAVPPKTGKLFYHFWILVNKQLFIIFYVYVFQDFIAFPQFSSGAMEHWGIIGFRENLLLYSDSLNSILAKQDVALVIAHELAHFVSFLLKT